MFFFVVVVVFCSSYFNLGSMIFLQNVPKTISKRFQGLKQKFKFIQYLYASLYISR